MVESTVGIGVAKMNPISVPTDALSSSQTPESVWSARMGGADSTSLHATIYLDIGGLEHDFYFFHMIIGDNHPKKKPYFSEG